MVITVTDSGSGMSEEILPRIFEPFFTTKSEGKGVGLGLAIAYGIIERHRGTIEVESAVGRGTTFTVTLPLKQTTTVPQTAPAAP
jgi:signal transduction histidine kinase